MHLCRERTILGTGRSAGAPGGCRASSCGSSQSLRAARLCVLASAAMVASGCGSSPAEGGSWYDPVGEQLAVRGTEQPMVVRCRRTGMLFRLVQIPAPSGAPLTAHHWIYVAESELGVADVKRLLGRHETEGIRHSSGLVIQPSSSLLDEIIRKSGHALPTASELGFLERAQIEFEVNRGTYNRNDLNLGGWRWSVLPSRSRPRGRFGLFDVNCNLPEYCSVDDPRDAAIGGRWARGNGPIGYQGIGGHDTSRAWGVRLVRRVPAVESPSE